MAATAHAATPGVTASSGTGVAASVTVGTAAELKKALEQARDGLTIKLKSGNYPEILVKGVDVKGNLTITSADPSKPATLAGLIVRESSGLTFSGLSIDARTSDKSFPVTVFNAKDIMIDGFVAVGGGYGANPQTVAAFMIRESSRVTVQKSQVSMFWHGLSMKDVTNVKILNNEFSKLRTDGIRGGGINNSLIQGNVMTEFYPLPADHCDGIQLWSTDQTESAGDVVIKDNLVVRGAGDATQGIFIRDIGGKLPFKNLTLTGNLVVGGRFNGIAIDGIKGAQLADNEVIAYPDRTSWIRVQTGERVTLSANKAMKYVLTDVAALSQNGDKVVAPMSHADASVRIKAWINARPGMLAAAGPRLRALGN